MAKKLGMGGFQKPIEGETDTWLTPKYITDDLGPFDLDPCTIQDRPWDIATKNLTIVEDGLETPWDPEDFVWCNPPYGKQTWKWMEKLSNHPGGGLALIYARTEVKGFIEHVWHKADLILFLDKRPKFCKADGTEGKSNGGAPSVIVAYGETAMDRLGASKLGGALVMSWMSRESNSKWSIRLDCENYE